jgi:hypothetical protein
VLHQHVSESESDDDLAILPASSGPCSRPTPDRARHARARVNASSVASGPPNLHPFLDDRGPIAIAHRGGLGEAPENTLPGFANAIALGIGTSRRTCT